MKRINNLTDDIYESLMDQDSESLNSSIKELQSVLRETQKLTDDEIKTETKRKRVRFN